MYISHVLKKEYGEKYGVDESNIAEHLKEMGKMARNSVSGAFKGRVGVEKLASRFIRRNVMLHQQRLEKKARK